MHKVVTWVLTRQAQRYLRKNNPKIVVVSGSVGKTSTTQAIATMLESSFNVGKTIENYNTSIGVPCSIFNRAFPENIKNPLAWLWVLLRNEIDLLSKSAIDIFVLELGTDTPGELAQYKWLKPDIAVVTAVAAEHMEYFKTIANVAVEELSVADYSKVVLLNEHMISSAYRSSVKNTKVLLYNRDDLSLVNLTIKNLKVIGSHSIDAIAAGIRVGRYLGIDQELLRKSACAIKPQPGRMSSLSGVNESTLIDDSYNASPDAVKAALDYLYDVTAPQRIALLGNMNELGDTSKFEHEAVGEYCDPAKLDLVVTLGVDANKYIAKSAALKGCAVDKANTPHQAAKIIKEKLTKGAVVLLEGSQNGVFAEEATKALLADQADVRLLVRQSDFWMGKKQKSFED